MRQAGVNACNSMGTPGKVATGAAAAGGAALGASKIKGRKSSTSDPYAAQLADDEDYSRADEDTEKEGRL